MLWSTYAFLRSYILWPLVDYLPLFAEVELLAGIWLVHPETLGARWAWSELDRLYAPFDGLIQAQLRTLLPPAARAERAVSVGEDEEEVVPLPKKKEAAS